MFSRWNSNYFSVMVRTVAVVRLWLLLMAAVQPCAVETSRAAPACAIPASGARSASCSRHGTDAARRPAFEREGARGVVGGGAGGSRRARCGAMRLRGGGFHKARKIRKFNNWKPKHKRDGENPLQVHKAHRMRKKEKERASADQKRCLAQTLCRGHAHPLRGVSHACKTSSWSCYTLACENSVGSFTPRLLPPPAPLPPQIPPSLSRLSPLSFASRG